MAFRLRPTESIGHGLRRLAAKELGSARDRLREADPPADEAIHEARKSVKKARAIMGLVESDAGSGLEGCRKRLRKVNRTLSRLRDADAMLEMLTKLKTRSPDVFDEHTFARLRRRLLPNKERAMRDAHDTGAFEIVDRALRTLRRRVRRWRPVHRRFRALAAGIRRTYRDGRRAMARARADGRATDYHESRKQLKALWHQARLVEGCLPGIRKEIAALHRAESWLGDDHNLVVLCATVSKGESPSDRDRLQRAVNQYQRELRRKALGAAAPVYRRTPGQYVRHVERAWHSWRRQQRRRTAAA